MQQLTASMNGLSFKQNIACTRGLTAQVSGHCRNCVPSGVRSCVDLLSTPDILLQRQVPCPERSARMPVVENRVAVSSACWPHLSGCLWKGSAVLQVTHTGADEGLAPLFFMTQCCMMFTLADLVQIRFQRRGRKKLPFYRIVAIDTRKQRDGKPIEVRCHVGASSSVLESMAGL